MVPEEPNFQNEGELEDAVGSAIQAATDGFVVVRRFGLDIGVFGGVRTCFFEIKAFDPSHGRCGINDGNQIRLLFDEETRTHRTVPEIAVLDNSVRWIIGHRGRPAGSQKFLFLTCRQILSAAAGGEIRPSKQNNIRLAMFDSLWSTWPVLLQQIHTFVFPN
jgi:hypothetical protein